MKTFKTLNEIKILTVLIETLNDASLYAFKHESQGKQEAIATSIDKANEARHELLKEFFGLDKEVDEDDITGHRG